MKCTVTDFAGNITCLPELLRWEFCRTDGEPCDSFCVEFAAERGDLQWLSGAVEFSALQRNQPVFTGVVDDYELRLSPKGFTAQISGRGMAARLMDNEVRAAEFFRAQAADIFAKYVLPYGVLKIEADDMPAVEQFAVETGDSCWQILCGFCRHSADLYPRFSADGTLIIRKEGEPEIVRIGASQVLDACFTDSRYGVASRQVMVNTRNGTQVTAENSEFLSRGGNSVRVNGRTGTRVRAVWRTAQQRLNDSARESRLLRLQVAGSFLAEPCQRVQVSLPKMGLDGVFTVQSVQSQCSQSGELCTLILR